MEIDWAEITSTMASNGVGSLLSSYLSMANRLFGMPLPPQTRGGLLLPELHFYRCLAQLRLPFLMEMGRIIGTIQWFFSPGMIHYKYGCERTLPSITRGRLREVRFLVGEYILSGRVHELLDNVRRLETG